MAKPRRANLNQAVDSLDRAINPLPSNHNILPSEISVATIGVQNNPTPMISQGGGFAARLVFHDTFAPQEYPPVNMYETGAGYLLFAELPGAKPNDIEIKLSHLTIEIRCRRNVDRHADITFRRQERWHGWRQKFLHFPEPVDGSLVEAELSHGWLRIVVPKLPQSSNVTVPVIDREALADE